jgi:hypothetical protein
MEYSILIVTIYLFLGDRRIDCDSVLEVKRMTFSSRQGLQQLEFESSTEETSAPKKNII